MPGGTGRGAERVRSSFCGGPAGRVSPAGPVEIHAPSLFCDLPGWVLSVPRLRKITVKNIVMFEIISADNKNKKIFFR